MRPLDSYRAFEEWFASMDWPMVVFLRPEDFHEIRLHFAHVGIDVTFGEYFCCGHTKIFSKSPSGKVMDFSYGIPVRAEGIS